MLFRFFLSEGIYCQRNIMGVDVEKIFSLLGISLDFIRPYDAGQGLGSIYLQVPYSQLLPLLL